MESGLEHATLVVFVTVPDASTGERLGRALVAERLAACVNRIAGVTSLFHWEGELQSCAEQLLILKTTSRRFEDLCARVRELHPDKVPEVIALPVVAGLPEYLSWVDQETSP